MNSSILILLANHLWQSTLFAGAVGALTLLVRKNSARVRYSLWLAASAKFLIPFALLTTLGTQIPWPFGSVPTTEPFLLSFAHQVAAPITLSSLASASTLARTAQAGHGGDAIAIALGALWLFGMLVIAIRWAVRWWLVRRAVREASQTGMPFLIPVRSSSSQLEPAVVGVLRPVLLIPHDMEQRLTSEEMHAILAHERCHVTWRDNLAAALHMLAEALFWFHPLIWWLGKRLIVERERACDERVLADGHPPESYAEGILKICEQYLQARIACVACISGADLSERIEGIMQNRLIERLSGVRKLVITLAACGTIVVPIAVGVLNSPQALAQAETPAAGAAVFHHVSIRLARSGQTNSGEACGPGIVLASDTRVTIGCPSLRLRSLIAGLNDVAESQVIGQDWSKEPSYDITADDPIIPAPNRAAAWHEVPAMMRNLLANQFGVVVRRERRQMESYVLTAGATGAKLKPYVGAVSWRTSAWGSRDYGLLVTDYPVLVLVSFIRNMYHMPVVDQTGLKGAYEYKVVWKSAPGATPDPRVVEKALQEQLGLRLETKRVTVNVIDVIRMKSPQQIVTH